jgi:hypothetical protein
VCRRILLLVAALSLSACYQSCLPSGRIALSLTGVVEAQSTDPPEEVAYKAFLDVKASDDKAVIKTGENFLQKYPNSTYREKIYSRLAQAYYLEQDLAKTFANGDKALALNPDNVDMLVLEGWLIPHSHDPNDPNMGRKLEKAEGYERRALELVPKMAKQAEMTDADFAKSQSALLTEAHSGLGSSTFVTEDRKIQSRSSKNPSN